MKSIEIDFRNRPNPQEGGFVGSKLAGLDHYMPLENDIDSFFERALLALASEPDEREG